MTTQGFNSGPSLDGGGPTGNNAPSEFVGGSNPDEFIGSVRESMTNSAVNRLFRAISGEEVPTGGNRDTSGQPRRVPVALRLGFRAPTPRAAMALAGRSSIELNRYLTARPDLAGVNLSMNDDGVATLQGIVSESSTRRLAANLIRMQPGVRRLQNQIEVLPSPAASP